MTLYNHKNLHANYIIEDGKLKISELSKGVLGIDTYYKNTNNVMNTIQDFDDRIKDVLRTICFSSKRIGYDQFVENYYGEDSIGNYIIVGSRNEYIFPRGTVCLHDENKIFYDVANIIYNVERNYLPIDYIEFQDIDKSNITIPRSDGSRQIGQIISNSALRISKSKGGIYVFVSFIDEKDKLDYEKHITFEDFVEINNIREIKINIPQIKKEDYDFTDYKYLSDTLINEIIEYYNKMSLSFYQEFVSSNLQEFTDDVQSNHNEIIIILNKT